MVYRVARGFTGGGKPPFLTQECQDSALRLIARSPHRPIASSPDLLIARSPHRPIARSPDRLIASSPHRLIASSPHPLITSARSPPIPGPAPDTRHLARYNPNP